MKLSAREAASYFAKPDPNGTGLLIYGEDTMRVATRRAEVIGALIGPQGEAEMRLTRIPASDLRKDNALLNDAMLGQSFFPGPRVALVEDATDGLAEVIGNALADWRSGDAQIIVTASGLTAKSALRKLFEGHNKAHTIGLYDDPPSQSEVDAMLTSAGLTRISRDAQAALSALSRSIDPGDFRQTVEKLGLYKLGDPTELSPGDIAAIAPGAGEVSLDDLLGIVSDGRTAEIASVLRRLYAQGTQPVGLCIGALRHFRALHGVASDPGGPSAGIGRLRPPVYGPRRDAMIRQAGQWGREKLERAVTLLLDTDLQLRNSTRAPNQALAERALIRLAMMARR